MHNKFITKNQFHNWTSKLACIWHVFRKLGCFWLFLSAPVLHRVIKTKRMYWKTCQMCANFDVQLWNWFFVMNSYSTPQVCMKFAYIVTVTFILNFGQCESCISQKFLYHYNLVFLYLTQELLTHTTIMEVSTWPAKIKFNV